MRRRVPVKRKRTVNKGGKQWPKSMKTKWPTNQVDVWVSRQGCVCVNESVCVCVWLIVRKHQKSVFPKNRTNMTKLNFMSFCLVCENLNCVLIFHFIFLHSSDFSFCSPAGHLSSPSLTALDGFYSVLWGYSFKWEQAAHSKWKEDARKAQNVRHIRCIRFIIYFNGYLGGCVWRTNVHYPISTLSL